VLVSCVMPTFDRRRFVPDAIENFRLQTYADRELIIVDDGTEPVRDLVPDDARIRYVRLDQRLTTGAKRNVACQQATGELIVHWDDDDWSAPERIEAQVRAIVESGADVCGQKELLFYEPAANRGWRYRYPERSRPWVAGGTMCYPREIWAHHPFPDVRQGEDTQFIWTGRGLRVTALAREDLYVATIHRGNTSAKHTSGRRWTSVPVTSIQSVLGEAADRYMTRGSGRTGPRTRRQEGPAMSDTVVITSPAHSVTSIVPPAETSPAARGAALVTVSIPHRGPGMLLRAAVDSILGQTCHDLICVVVFDGDGSGLAELADLDDPRLVRHVLPESRGRYFADQVVLDATTSPYFLVQDSDDWSEPTRLERLLAELERTRADVCLSDVVHHDARRGATRTSRHGWPRVLDPVGPELVHRAGHHGLYRTEMLRAVGGWYAGTRIGYDTSILNFVLMARGRLVTVPEPLYHRNIRSGSLSTSPETGWNTPERRRVVRELVELHRRAYAATRGAGAAEAARSVRRLVTERRGPDATGALEREAGSLTSTLSTLNRPDGVAGASGARAESPAFKVQPGAIQPRLPDVHWLLDQHGTANPGWSISPLGAIELDARLSRRRPARILDVGSGLSTVVAAVAAARYGGRVVSLEHDAGHADRTRRLLESAGVRDLAEVVVAPLVPRMHPCGTGPWYDGQPSGWFDFFIVDGPPLASGGRVATLPALAAHRRGDWELWLFDADRADERRCVEAWSRRFRFDCSFEPVDETGVAVLRSSGNGGSAGPVVDRLGISILTGDRPGLLARTLATFEARWPGQARAAHVCAFVNGADEASRSVVEAVGWIDRIMTYGPDVIPIGLATSLVIGAVAAHGDVDLVLHVEDDWETRTMDDEALVRAATYLEDETVGQVRVRHRSERCLPRHMITGKPIGWRRHDDYLRGLAHFTFNPALIRAGLVDRIFPARDERHAQRRFLMTGLDVVQLEPGVFAHSGDQRSRRLGRHRRGAGHRV